MSPSRAPVIHIPLGPEGDVRQDAGPAQGPGAGDPEVVREGPQRRRRQRRRQGPEEAAQG